jgi:hypothetical protein
LVALDCVGDGFDNVLAWPLISADGSFYAANFRQSVPITGNNYDPLSALLFSKKPTGEAQTFLYPKFWRSRVWNWNKQNLMIAFWDTVTYKQTLATFSLSSNRLQTAFTLPEPLDGTPEPIISSKGYYVALSHLTGPKGIHLTLFDLNERQLAFSNPNGNTIRPGEDLILTVTPSLSGHNLRVQLTCTADEFACAVTPQSQVISGPTEIRVRLESRSAKSKFMLTSALCLLGVVAVSKKRTLAALTLTLCMPGCGAPQQGNAHQKVVLTASTPEQTVQTTLQIVRN